jgi:hypothetical protein
MFLILKKNEKSNVIKLANIYGDIAPNTIPNPKSLDEI